MVCVGPGQLIPPPSKIGVKVTSATAGVLDPFVALKAGIFPEPLSPRPIVLLLFTHV